MDGSSGEPGKKKAKSGNFGDGPSSFPWMADGVMDNGAAESGGGEEPEAAAEEASQDPLVVFGSGVMMMILGKLDARSVALGRLVSSGWLEVASIDKIWAPKDLVLFRGIGILNADSIQNIPPATATREKAGRREIVWLELL